MSMKIMCYRFILNNAAARRKILVLSSMANIAGEEFVAPFARAIYETAISEPLNWTERFYTLCQTRIGTFLTGMSENYLEAEGAYELLSAVVEDREKALGRRLSRMEPQERDPEQVVIFTTQMLNNTHAPTLMVLELGHYIKKTQGRNVTIVNTMEAGSPKGEIPYAYAYVPTLDCPGIEYIQTTNFGGSRTRDAEYLGESFSYVDFGNSMADDSGIKKALALMASIRPYFVVSIGAPSVIAELCSSIAPTISFGGQAGLPLALRQAAVAFRELSDTEERVVSRFFRSRGQAVICPIFYPKFLKKPPQDRRAYGLPEGRKLLAVVGSRLRYEVSGDFLETLRLIVERTDAFVVFVGIYETYNAIRDELPWMAGGAALIGVQLDLMGFIAMCDLFINPPRQGGGTSGAMALACGKPVVTLPRCDVGEAAGPDFCVASQSDMIAAAQRYLSDAEFYEKMSGLALERAARVCDASAGYDVVFEKFFNCPAWEWGKAKNGVNECEE